MAEKNSDRDSFFPAIEKKHGLPMSYWFEQMSVLVGKRYPEQIALLKEKTVRSIFKAITSEYPKLKLVIA